MRSGLKGVIVGIGVAAFVCAATLPHHHDTSSVSHQAATCHWDLPTGATVVCAFGVTLVVTVLARTVVRDAG